MEGVEINHWRFMAKEAGLETALITGWSRNLISAQMAMLACGGTRAFANA